jgi:hypothetical protein
MDKLTYKKGDLIKLIDPQSKLVSILEGDGWKLLEAEKPKKKKDK